MPRSGPPDISRHRARRRTQSARRPARGSAITDAHRRPPWRTQPSVVQSPPSGREQQLRGADRWPRPRRVSWRLEQSLRRSAGSRSRWRTFAAVGGREAAARHRPVFETKARARRGPRPSAPRGRRPGPHRSRSSCKAASDAGAPAAVVRRPARDVRVVATRRRATPPRGCGGRKPAARTASARRREPGAGSPGRRRARSAVCGLAETVGARAITRTRCNPGVGAEIVKPASNISSSDLPRDARSHGPWSTSRSSTRSSIVRPAQADAVQRRHDRANPARGPSARRAADPLIATDGPPSERHGEHSASIADVHRRRCPSPDKTQACGASWPSRSTRSPSVAATSARSSQLSMQIGIRRGRHRTSIGSGTGPAGQPRDRQPPRSRLRPRPARRAILIAGAPR